MIRGAAWLADLVDGRVGRRRHVRRALILDPALHSLGGHHYTAVEQLQRELRRLDIGFHVLGSAYADERVRGTLGVLPCFQHSIYGREDSSSAGFAERVKASADSLDRMLPRLFKPDLVIMPACDQILTAALAGCMRRWWHRPRVLLWLLYPPLIHPQFGGTSAQAEDEYREAFAQLKACLPNPRDLVAFCETEALAAAYRQLLNIDVAVAQGPGLVATEREDGPRRGKDDPRIVSIGYANAAKGYELLPRAIRLVHKTEPQVRFFIHGSRAQMDANSDTSTFDALRTFDQRVVTNTQVLESNQYLAWLRQADLLLLPYDPAIYATRGSGVFTDAMRLGIPSIVTARCDFARQSFSDGCAVPIMRHDSEGVADAIITAVRTLPLLTERARRARIVARSKQTAVRSALELLAHRD